MPNMMDMMKQMKQLRKVQKELTRKTVAASSPDGLVAVQARGDMTVKSITIDRAARDALSVEALAGVITKTVNSALAEARRAAADDMSKLTGGLGGLGGLMGG